MATAIASIAPTPISSFPTSPTALGPPSDQLPTNNVVMSSSPQSQPDVPMTEAIEPHSNYNEHHTDDNGAHVHSPAPVDINNDNPTDHGDETGTGDGDSSANHTENGHEIDAHHDVALSDNQGSPIASTAIPDHVSVGVQTLSILRKRDGRRQLLNPAKMVNTLRKSSFGLHVQSGLLREIVNKVIPRITSDMTTYELQGLLALNANMFSFIHPDYSTLAGRVFSDRIHKSTVKAFSEWVNIYGTRRHPLLRPDFVANVARNADQLDAAIMHVRDFDYYFYSLQTMYRFYLLRDNGRVIERPQFLYMRIAVATHGADLPRILETYEVLSARLYSPSTAVLYTAGTVAQNFASCFVSHPPRDSPAAIMDQVLDDLSSLWAMDAGVGLSLDTVPAKKVTIRASSSGPVPMLSVIDAYASFTCSNRWRHMAVATTYLPIWHSDVQAYVQASTRSISTDTGLRYVFPALLIPNLFMQRLRDGGHWSLFDPDDVPLLFDVAGEDFDAAYQAYEAATVAVEQLEADALWLAVTDVVSDGALPLLVFSDNMNSRNNEAHLGLIRGSSLCAEVAQHGNPQTPAVCMMACISLPRFIRDGAIDFDSLHRITTLAVINTDKSIDAADYPSDSIDRAAKSTRALGISVQGLADVFMILGIPFTSSTARQLNVDIHETIYHAALDASCRLAEEHGPYPNWEGSPASEGTLQIDMWSHTPSPRHDFPDLRRRIALHGLRNSVLTALSLTGATSKLFSNFEGFEPTTTILRTSAGSFPLICPHLVRDLISRGLWNEPTRREILRNTFSIQSCSTIPDDLKSIYATAWDIDPIVLIDMAAERAPYIDQSQSLTFCLREPTPHLLKQLMLHAWSSGLKTGIYCLRTLRPSHSTQDPAHAIQFVARSQPVESYT